MIKIGFKALAKYMTTANATQRKKILRDYKYPDPEGRAQATYYHDARDSIKNYHRFNRDPDWLRAKADKLRIHAVNASGSTKTRLRNNPRALQEYVTHFGGRKYEILQDFRYNLHIKGVTIKVVADLHVREKGKERLIKLEFSKDKHDAALPRYMSQMLFEAMSRCRPDMGSSSALYFDVHEGKIHKGARINARAGRVLEETCEEIAERWNKIL